MENEFIVMYNAFLRHKAYLSKSPQKKLPVIVIPGHYTLIIEKNLIKTYGTWSENMRIFLAKYGVFNGQML